MSNATHRKRIVYRSNLLATVSAIALIGSGITTATAADADRPLIWIDLGWHFEHDGGGQQEFAPSFENSIISNGFSSPSTVESALPWSYGAEGGISFQPENSDWTLAISARYGRTHGRKSFHEQTPATGTWTYHLGTLVGHRPRSKEAAQYVETNASNMETHVILDFMAGKDIGVGLFGAESTSVLSTGVRYTHIKFGSHSEINGDPDKYLPTDFKYAGHKYAAHNHIYHATSTQMRSFSGVGPALSWNSSAPFAGNLSDGELTLDFGVNGGFLFGRQKASGHHQTKSNYYRTPFGPISSKYHIYHQHPAVPHDRSRSVTVPNLGGFAGISLKWTNAKISLGYRADVFFGAIDGGIDTRKSENRGFYGPFASISIGLGD